MDQRAEVTTELTAVSTEGGAPSGCTGRGAAVCGGDCGSDSPPPRALRRLKAGQHLYWADGVGRAWRVVTGTIRLDRNGTAENAEFAGLAIPGDVIGAESMLFGRYTFDAVALCDAAVEPWPEGGQAPAMRALLQCVVDVEHRAADIVALRYGEAVDRVQRLIRLLTRRDDDGCKASVVLPPRKDIAEITALNSETVSRTITRLRRDGILTPYRARGIHGRRGFIVTGWTA